MDRGHPESQEMPVFEYLCPKCNGSTQVDTVADGTTAPCRHCGQRLRVLVEGEGDLSLMLRPGERPTELPTAPAGMSAPWVVGICGGVGVTVAALIIVVWAMLDSGSDGVQGPREQSVAQAGQKKPGENAVPPPKADPPRGGEEKGFAPKQAEPKGDKDFPPRPAIAAKAGGGKDEGWLAQPPSALTPEEIPARTLKSTVWIVSPAGWGTGKLPIGWGSGSLISRDRKLVLTNEHVVGDLKEVRVFFPEYHPDGTLISDRKQYHTWFARGERGLRGTVLAAKDPLRDLALIRLEADLPEKAQALPFSNRKIGTNQTVLSIGNPGSSGGQWINTPGVIRGIYPAALLNSIGGRDVRREFLAIETQSPTDPGDSGGPLVNEHAELVGVLHGSSPGARLRTYFIHLKEVKKFLEDTSYKDVWTNGRTPPGEAVGLAKLRDALQSKDVNVARSAAAYLAQMGPEAGPALDDLIQVLRHKDPTVRRLACQALGEIGEAAGPAAPHLAKVLDDLLEIRVAALKALARLGRAAAVAVPRVRELLEAPEKDTQESALRVLIGLGPEARAAVPDLARLLPAAAPNLKLLITEALGAVGPDAAAASPQLGGILTEQLGDKKLQEAALVALFRIGAGGRQALPAVTAALRGPNLGVRRLAIIVLEKIGADADGDQATIAILEALEANPPFLMLEDACYTWAAFGPKARFAIPYLKERRTAKTAKTDRVLWNLADRTLQKIGSDLVPSEYLPVFLSVFADATRKVHVRAYAGRALVEYAGAKADLPVAKVEQLLGDGDFELRGLAALALGKLGPRARGAVPGLARLLSEDKEAAVRLKAVTALQSLGAENPPAAVPALSQALRDGSSQVRLEAAVALAAIGPQAAEAVPNLTLGLRDTDRGVRLQAAWTLGRIGPKASPAVQALTAAAYDSDTGLRQNAVLALGAIGSPAARAVPALLMCLRDKQLRDRDAKAFGTLWGAAVNALAGIGEPARKQIGSLELLKNWRDWYEVTGAVRAIEKIAEKSRLSKDVLSGYVAHIQRYVLRPMDQKIQQAQALRINTVEFEELRQMVREAVARLKEL